MAAGSLTPQALKAVRKEIGALADDGWTDLARPLARYNKRQTDFPVFFGEAFHGLSASDPAAIFVLLRRSRNDGGLAS